MGKKLNQILFINQCSGYLMIDIIRAYGGIYDERILLAGSINSQNIQIPDDIKVHKLFAYNRKSKFMRLFTWTIAFIQTLWFLKTRYRNSFLFIVSNPPLAVFIPLFCNNPFLLLIYDIFPDAIINSKLIDKTSVIAKIWNAANKVIFYKARRIITISDGMKHILQQYHTNIKIDVIPIWANTKLFTKVTKDENFFLLEQGLTDKFVILYSGNLGYSHDVEVIVELAEMLQDVDVFFLIIGSGGKYSNISNQINLRGLTNCRILPLQPSNILPYSFSAADIAIVTLSKNASNLSVPSKTYNYLSVGAPLLCIAEQDSELGKLVSKYSIGMCFSKDQTVLMSQYILKVKSDILYKDTLAKNAYLASLDFGPENALKFVADV